MVKKSLLFLIFLTTYISCLSYTKSIEESKREALVFIKKGFIEFPVMERNAINLQNINIKSIKLKREFLHYSVETIARAFPDFTDADTVRYLNNGRKVEIPPLFKNFCYKIKI